MLNIVKVEGEDPKLKALCGSALFDPSPAARNMELLDWENRPETLWNHVFKQRTYDTGGFYYLEKDGEAVAAAGYYKLPNENIAVGPTRLYTKYDMSHFARVKHATTIMRHVTDEIISEKFIGAMCFVNEYNLNLKKIIPMNDTPGKKNRYGNRKMKFLPYHQPVNYLYTKQWAMYQVFEENCEKVILNWLENNHYYK